MTRVPSPTLFVAREGNGTLAVRLAGNWRLAPDVPSALVVERELDDGTGVARVCLEGAGITDWGSALPAFLARLAASCGRRGIPVERRGLPPGVERLLALAAAVPEREAGPRGAVRPSFLARLGGEALRRWRSEGETLAFLGQVCLSLARLLRGRAQFQAGSLFVLLQQAGAEALPVVSLISALVGLILAFVGGVQLKAFGVQAYVADLVGIGMIREMGAMMTGILMAGRTGAAYAAQLGAMQVSEELDAFRTFGIDPIDFLVLPRILALAVMLPLLCAYSDLMGVLGGAVVGVASFDIPLAQYLARTQDAVPLRHFWVGIGKSAVYGVVVAGSGCLRGIQCGRSASAVGEATTSAVVTAIVWIVVWCALTTVILQVLGV